MNLKSFLEQSSFKLRQAGSDSPRLDAELLAQHVLGLSKIDLLTKDQDIIPVPLRPKLQELLVRRLDGEPVAYLTGKKEFFGFDFSVGDGVLVPRPETEYLVEEGLAAIQHIERALIADMGSGSGCVGLSILLENKGVKAFLIESSEKAFSYLEQNTKKFEMHARATLIDTPVESSQFDQIFDLIVSNPPYIAKEDSKIHPWVRRHEPSEALFSPENGLKIPQQWLALARLWIKPGGTILFEIGSDQGPSLLKWCAENMLDFDVTLGKDLAGLDRYLKLVDTRLSPN